MKTIMLVDDSTTIVLSVSEIITKAGYQVVKATNGVEALDKIKSGKKPDLIITDLNMPQMNGIDLIREVRKLPGFRFTPILMLTTESQQTKRMEGKEAGATGWLVKPVSGPDLVKTIKQVLPGA